MSRRCNDEGKPMLVNLPQEGYENTNEGGLAFFFIVKPKPFEERRQTCMAGDIMYPLQDCQISPKGFPHLPMSARDGSFEWRTTPIDAGLLIGSTGLSLWSDNKDEYFTPKVSDLTPDGKRLYHTLKRLYGEVTIVTLLDT